MTEPKVSIGLPVFNGENYLATALHSIVNQDYEDFELIISDNASYDRTAAICKDAAERDKRIRYSRVEVNCGAAPNFRRVFQLSTAKYFKWATHDDVCLPGFLKRCVETMERAPSGVVLVYPRGELIDATGKVVREDYESIESNDPRPHRRAAHVIQNVNLAWAQFGLIRSDALRKTRLMDSFIGSDYVLLAELAMLGELREIPEILFQQRVYAGSSNVVHKTRSQWLAWLDSTRVGRQAVLPSSVQVGWECGKSAKRLPLAAKEQILCGFAVPVTWYVRNLRRIGGQYKQMAMQSLGSRKKEQSK